MRSEDTKYFNQPIPQHMLPSWIPEGDWWRVPGYSDYVVNESSVVRRLVGIKRGDGLLLQTFVPVKGKSFPNGYYRVTMMSEGDGQTAECKKPVSVHILVCSAFHGPKPTPKHEVNHLDGNKINNHPSNLAWATKSENIQHSYTVLGRVVPKGKDHHLFGKSRSEATRALMSAKKTGELHPKFKGYYVTPAGVFATAALAAGPNNISAKAVGRRCNDPWFTGVGWLMSMDKNHPLWIKPEEQPAVKKERLPVKPADRYYNNVNY